MKSSFTPPPLLFWAYVALSALFVVLFEISDGGDARWWGILISLTLLVGLHRGMRLAWWLLFVFGAWTLVAIYAIQAEGLGLDGSEVALITIVVVQLAVLLAIRKRAASPA